MASFKHGLLIHPRTQTQIETFLGRPAHAIILIGPAGAGKHLLAQTIAANVLDIDDIAKLEQYPYYLELITAEDKKEIPIDDVRQLINKLRLKTPGKDAIRRIVTIDGAQNLSSEAQNALLKTLEEPGSDTAFILTTPSLQAVAPTIASRAQHVTVHPVTNSAAQDFYAGQFAKAEIDSNWLLSAGAPALLDSLLKTEAEHPLKDAVNNFKKFIGLDTYQRVLYCETLSRDKLALGNFIDGGKRVLGALHKNSIKNGRARQAKNLNNSRKLLNSLQAKLDNSGNARLIALSLAINLKL